MIHKLCMGEMQENCYIIAEDKNCVVIDPGDDFIKLKNFIDKNMLNIKAVLLTHGHFDHCASCKKLQEMGIKVYIHKLDADKLTGDGNLATLFNAKFENFTADCLIDERTLKIDDFEFTVIHTPGHSKGSVCYIYKNNVFCGDTIFESGGIGRTDFYDGSYIELSESIKKLKPFFEKGYNFFYGH